MSFLFTKILTVVAHTLNVHVAFCTLSRKVIAERTQIPGPDAGRPFAWNDMDMLETGNYRQAAHANGKTGNMTSVEYRTEVSMWAILASPLTLGRCWDQLSQSRVSLVWSGIVGRIPI